MKSLKKCIPRRVLRPIRGGLLLIFDVATADRRLLPGVPGAEDVLADESLSRRLGEERFRLCPVNGEGEEVSNRAVGPRVSICVCVCVCVCD